MAIRATIRPFIWKIIRSGAQTNAWSDKWNQICPLNSFVSPRNIANAGFQLNSSIADIIDENGQWKWPSAWYDIYPVLIGLTVPHLVQELEDSTTWKDLDGNTRPFGSMEVWHNTRHREQQAV